MEWYWWVLIAMGLVVFVILKIKVGGAFLRTMKQRQEAARRRLEEDE